MPETSAHTRPSDLDDVQLIDRCRAGDERAWRTLVRRYRSLVYSAVLRTGLDEELAADVFQMTWVELHRSLDRLRDAQALPKWLTVTARRIAYKTALRNDRPVEGSMEELVDPAALPGEELATLQRLQELERAIESLGGTCTKLLRLLFLDRTEPDYKEVSASVGIAIGSVGPLRGRCLARLRRKLEEEHA